MPDRLFPDDLKFLTPSETLKNYAFDFTDEIPASDSLSLANSLVSAIDDDGVDVSATIVSGKNLSGTQLRANLAGWEDGKNYLVTFKAIMTTSGEAAEKFLKVKARAQSAVG